MAQGFISPLTLRWGWFAADFRPMDEGFLRFSERALVECLDNGLQVIIVPDRTAPVVSVQVWVRTGSMDEAGFPGSGMAHLLEHMVFKGTRSFGLGEAASAIQDAGGQMNAYTTYDRTVYYADLPAAGVAEAIKVLGELVFFPKLPADEYEREREVVRREIAMGRDNPGSVLFHATMEQLFSGCAAEFPVIGYLEAFDRLRHENLVEFHRQSYSPGRVFVMVTGDVDAEAVAGMVRELAGGLAAMPGAPAYYGGVSAPLLPRRRTLAFTTDLARWQSAWLAPCGSDPAAPAVGVLSGLLGSGKSSRLHHELHEELGVAHGVSGSLLTFGPYGAFIIGAACDPGREDDLRGAALAVVERLAEDGITEDELSKAKKQCLSDFYDGFGTCSGIASSLGLGWQESGSLDFWDRYAAGLRELTPEKIRATAAEILLPQRRVESLMLPHGMQAKRRPTQVLAKVGGREPELVCLPGGGKVLLVPDDRLPIFSAHACFRGGAAADTHFRPGLASWLCGSLLKGTERRDAAKLMRDVEEAGGSLEAGSGNNLFTVECHGLAESAEITLAAVREVIEEASFPEEGIERERAKRLAGLRERDHDPLRWAFARARGLALAGTPHATPSDGTVEGLAVLTGADLKRARRDLLHGGNGVLALAGAFERNRVIDEVVQWWKPPEGGGAFDFRRGCDMEGADVVGNHIEHSMKKEQATVVLAWPFGGLSDPHLPALEMVSEATGDMGSRMFRRIREEQGLVYYVGPTMITGAGGGCFFFYLGTSGEKVDHALRELREEVSRLAADGIDPEELERARQTWSGRHLLGRQMARDRARQDGLHEVLGLGFKHSEQRLQQVRDISREQIRAACAAVFGKPPVSVVVRPEGEGAISNSSAD